MSASIEEFDFSVDVLSALIWRNNEATHLQSLLQAKRDWYADNHEQFWTDWVANVFNLDTANEFGLSVWALILGVPLSLIVAANTGPQFGFDSMVYATPYNIAPTSDQPVTSAVVSTLRRRNWQGDVPMFTTSRTNLSVQSTSLSGWSFATTVTSNAATAPDGTATASLFTETTANVVHNAKMSGQTISGGANYTWSAYAKFNGRRYLTVIFDNGNGNGILATFDLINGTISGAATVNGTATVAGSGIISLGNGWYRCWISGHLAVGDTSARTSLVFNTSPTVNWYPSYAGDGVSGMYLWGAQLEIGTVPTSYIPTTTESVTVTDYSVTDAGALTLANAPSTTDPTIDEIYGSWTYTNAAGQSVSATNQIIEHTLATGTRQNFNHGNFGASQAGVGLTIDQKRILLQLQYYKLISRCTVTEINARMKAILGSQGSVYVLDGNNMEYTTYVFGFQPSSALQFILENYDVLPRPAAVGVKIIVSTRPAFGFGSFNQNFNNGTFWAEN